jgi:putative membrane protein
MRLTKTLPFFATAALVLALNVPPAHAAETTTTQDFVRGASIGGEFEIQTSRLALEKTKNPDIRQFAQMMIHDHTQASDKLKSLLTSQEAQAAPNGLDSTHQAMLDQLKTESGEQFNRDYIKDQQAAHEEAVSLFATYAQTGESPKLKQFASQTLPTLRMHQRHANALKS